LWELHHTKTITNSFHENSFWLGKLKIQLMNGWRLSVDKFET
jgi:hypothetical protein